MEIPAVRFIYAYPLDEERRRLFLNKDMGYYPTISEVKEKIATWERLWDEVNYEQKVINALHKITNSTPKRNLECFVFGGGMGAMSTPLLLPILLKDKSHRSDASFIQTLIHELIHIFISESAGYWKMISVTHANETQVTRNHILVYAILENIYDDLFAKLPEDFHRENMPAEYERAITIVKEVGATKLIKDFQKFTNKEQLVK